MSYGYDDTVNPSFNYAQRQCAEYMKLALQGTTFLIASGDWGIADHAQNNDPTSGCITGTTLSREAPQYVSARKDTHLSSAIFTSGWPSDCPFVTSVGATQLNSGATTESVMQQAEDNAGNSFSSGGGFSAFFPAPDYQQATLTSWFASHDPGYPTYVTNANATNLGENGGFYNRAGRGFPDVSANGENFGTFIQGSLQGLMGTSLAAPAWAAIVTLINQERQAVGKSAVGFINPVLYAHPEVFTDITAGSNPNCNLAGFSAVKGWDPVTGLGTPNYPALLQLFLSLP